MKRSMCGMLVLAAAAGLWGCGSDPTGDTVGADLTVRADPTSIFLAQGESKSVIVSVTDAQGNEVDITDLQIAPGSGSIQAAEDTTYLVTTNGAALRTSRRVFVTGTSPGATTLTITANGQPLAIPVRVTPTSTTVTLSNPAPAANEPLVVTLPEGYKFGAGAGISVNDQPSAVQSVSPDSSSITVLPVPGASGTVTVDSVTVSFAPGVLFSLPTSDSVTVGAVTPLAGTGATGTAPALTIGEVGTTSVFYDGGTFDYAAPILGGEFGTFPARLYKITVADSTTLTTTVDWPSPEDLGLYFFESDGTTEVGTAGDAGGGAAHPEGTTNTFGPGTYYMAVVNFNETNPPYFTLSVTNEAPEVE